MKKIFALILTVTIAIQYYSQQLYFQNITHGGVSICSKNFSLGGNDTLIFNLDIPPNSNINRAFLIAGGYGNGMLPYNIKLNGNSNVINTSNIIMGVNSIYANPAQTFFLDVTNDLLSVTNTCTLIAENLPFGQNDRMNDFCLVVFYDLLTNYNINFSLYINNIDFSNFNPTSLQQIGGSYINPYGNGDIAYSLFCGYICDSTLDGDSVYIENNFVGIIGGSEDNGICDGPNVSNHFDSTSLTCYNDDNSDILLSGTDVTSNVASLIDLNFDPYLNLTFTPLDSANKSNSIWAHFLTYSTPCDTFTTNINFTDTTICANQPLQLEINGLPQYSYEWHQLDSILGTDSVLNLTPEHSQLYSVWVKDTNGCMVTEMVNITVNENPTIDSIVVTPTLCADSTGTIEVVGATGGSPYFGSAYIYTLNGSNNTNISEYNNDFIHLDSGDYIIRVTDDIGCYFEDTVQLDEYINVNASFSASVTSGEYPLTVDFNNLSNNADGYFWYLLNDTLTTTNASTLFDTTGIYTVELVAWQNEPRCADTTIKTINVKAPFKVTVPSVFNAHTGPFSVYAYGTKEIDFTVFNSIGQLVYQASVNITDGENTIWIDQEVSQGIYHYRMTATGVNGDEQSKSGKILVIK